ncbi:hypothetical protein [Thermocrinis sp.]|uniref:hypothetical protein n=1 Tax=Thermocrinis sp. TaxID=2024383 RepID=UPI003C04F4A6
MGGRLVKGMFHRAIISGMAVSPEDLAAGALALQTFIKNAKYVEIIVNVAFGAIPSILGIGAAGLLGSGIINTARDVVNSISLLRTAGPTMEMGWKAWKGRKEYGVKWQQSDKKGFWGGAIRTVGVIIAPIQWAKSKLKKNNQDTQDKQDKQDGGRSGGNPPTPPDTKSDKKDEEKKQ